MCKPLDENMQVEKKSGFNTKRHHSFCCELKVVNQCVIAGGTPRTMDAVSLSSIIFVLLLILKGINSVVIQNIYTNGCNNEKIELKCPDYHKIAIKRLFFGVKNDRKCVEEGRQYSVDCCQRTQHDCLVTDDRKYSRLNSGCSGYSECRTDSLSIETRGTCKNPNWSYTDYMTVIHDCVPENDIAEFCMNHQKRGKYLYLSNQRYPSPIQGGHHHCSCLVKTGSTQGLNIHAIDISITQSEYGPKSCAQEIQIQDSYGVTKVITCGHQGLYGFRAIYKPRVENVTITLDSSSSESRGYIWMQIKAESPDDFVMIYCGDALTALYEQNREKLPTGDSVQTDTSNADHSETGTGKGRTKTPEIIPDNIAIIAGICCAVGVILVISVAAIVIHCKRIRVRKKPRNNDTFPSPIPKSKSLPMDASSYCKYDYDEDHYCTIRRSPMKVSNFTEVDTSADKKLREAFLQGLANDTSNSNHVQTPLLTEKEKQGQYKTICKIPPVQSQMTEIKVHTLPHKSKPKGKTVTFSPVAMVSPLNSGSEESMSGKEILEAQKKPSGTFPVQKWQHGQGNGYLPQSDKTKPIVIVTGPKDESLPTTIHGTINDDDDSWKSLTTYDEGMYDNIQYLLKQNAENANKYDQQSKVVM